MNLTEEQTYDLIDLIGAAYHQVLDNKLRPAHPDEFDRIRILSQHKRALEFMLERLDHPVWDWGNLPEGIADHLHSALDTIESDIEELKEQAREKDPLEGANEDHKALYESIHTHLKRNQEIYQTERDIIKRAENLVDSLMDLDRDFRQDLNDLKFSVQRLQALENKLPDKE